MKRTDLIASLNSYAGGRPWISKNRLKKWLGVGDEKLEEITKDLVSRQNGRAIEFWTGDIADVIMRGVSR